MTFAFSSYVNAPRGWNILRADAELWLRQGRTGRIWIITNLCVNEFELFYTTISNPERTFVCRSNSVFDMWRKVGLLMPQPTMHEQTLLTIKRKYLKK